MGELGSDETCNISWIRSGSDSYYPRCVSDYECARQISLNCNSSGPESCSQFCRQFRDILPSIYMSLSFLSALCCMVVFATYFAMPRLRRTGYSSKVFLNRTFMDFVIAVGHILAGIATLAGSEPHDPRRKACMALGTVNEFALVASNVWYVFLAVDLIRAIRNPFSSQPSYTVLYNVIVLLFSLLLAGILAVLTALDGPGGPGTSMFFFCWVGVENGENNYFTAFFLITFFLYYLWHVVFWVFSLVVIVVAGCILWGHLAASSETRKFVLKQNLVYVLILGIETLFIVTFWIAQFALVEKHGEGTGAYFFTTTDLSLAILFAIIHSLRGAVDLFVWGWTFSIGWGDFGDCFKRYRIRFSTRKEQYIPPRPTNKDPLLTTDSVKDNLVNKALRRNAIYCINVGILDAVQLDLELCRKNRRVGSVRDAFAAAALVEMDQENQRGEVALLHNNPNYREQVVRKLRFPASSTHIKGFSFIDLEPTTFSLLRESYGISPRAYRKSFDIKNAADIDGVRFIEKSTEGKSGSFFYFTPDNRFIIKNVNASEEKFLCKVAYEYYEHMKDNKDSLIVRFFGLHKVQLAPEQRYITVVVMENIFYTSDRRKIQRRFDLKGSWVGRRSLKAGQRSDEYKGTLKDLDLGEEKIFIGSDQKEQLMEILRKDVAFLTKCHIMDYSLLLGILQDGGKMTDTSCASSCSKFGDFPTVELAAQSTSTSKAFEEPCSIFESSGKKLGTFNDRRDTVVSNFGYDKDLYIPWYRQDGGGLHSVSSFSHDFELSVPSNRDSMVKVGNPPVTYFFGIVDILQQYTLRKKVEHLWKTRILRQDRQGLSAVSETAYGNRFLNFLDKIIE